MSLDDVRELASVSAVRSIEAIEPDRPQVISQGTQAHNAARWHAGGHVGAGVKVGIMDSFEGILQLMGNELPASVVARCYTSVGVHSSSVAACDGGNNHGSAVAESLVDIAPAVQLYIANPISRVDQLAHRAVDAVERCEDYQLFGIPTVGWAGRWNLTVLR